MDNDKLRLDRVIASVCGCTRSEAKALIRRGRVMQNGTVLSRPEMPVSAQAGQLTVDGRPVAYQKYEYLILNKPAGILSVSHDPSRETVVDLVPPQWRRRGLFPAGRLDRDTTGLLILTDDGDFAHRLTAPKHHVEKEYVAVLDRLPMPDAAAQFEAGILLADESRCKPAQLTVLSETPPTVRVILREGMYHQIKRMLAVCGAGVSALHRSRIGGLLLPQDLAEGECRILTEEERAKIFL